MSQNTANLQMTVGGVAIVILIAGAMWFGFGPDPQPPLAAAPAVEAPTAATVTVHVSGFVSHPGVVVVAATGRVADAISAAGGATGEADLSRLNLAATIQDGDHITVPGREQPGVSTTPVLEEQGININTSHAAQLEGLPGVGPVLAQRIVAFRESNGTFDTVEDLLDVPGIGEAKLAGMRDDIASP